MRRTQVVQVSHGLAQSQVGPHARWGKYFTPLSGYAKPRDTEHAAPEQTFSTTGMRPGTTYEMSTPGMMREKRVPKFTSDDVKYTESQMGGFGHETIPSRALHWQLAFDKCEPGNVVPRRYLGEVVEPLSHDPEKHPIPVLEWFHKRGQQQHPISYKTDAGDIATEGEDRNPFEFYRNPTGRLYFTKSTTELQKNQMSHYGMKRWCWWNKGNKRLQMMKKGRNNLKKRQGHNPWWVRMLEAQYKIEGHENVRSHTTPHWAYYKFIPILGFNGFGTKQGEINVDLLYNKIGLDQIQWWVDTGLLNTNEVITPNTLVEAHLVEDYHWPGIKIVSGGCAWFNAKIDIEAENVDEDAADIIRKAGGTVTTRWRDEEGVAKEKFPWRFPVIGNGKLPPEELIRDVYTNNKKGGYLSDYYQQKLRANPENPREWSLISKTPDEVGEIPPEPKKQTAQPAERRPNQVSLQKKQAYWEDYLDNTANTPGSRLGMLTPKPFALWEYTYTHHSGPGHPMKRDPPAGMENVVYPGYPLRDSQYFVFMADKRAKQKQSEAEETDPYATTQMETVTVQKKMAWEIKGEGWRTKEDAEIKYRNPHKNPFLKARIEAWQKEQQRKKKLERDGKK